MKNTAKIKKYVLTDKQFGNPKFIARVMVGDDNNPGVATIVVNEATSYTSFISPAPSPVRVRVDNETTRLSALICNDVEWKFTYSGFPTGKSPDKKSSNVMNTGICFCESVGVMVSTMFAWKVAKTIFGDTLELDGEAYGVEMYNHFEHILDIYHFGEVTESDMIPDEQIVRGETTR